MERAVASLAIAAVKMSGTLDAASCGETGETKHRLNCIVVSRTNLASFTTAEDELVRVRWGVHPSHRFLQARQRPVRQQLQRSYPAA